MTATKEQIDLFLVSTCGICTLLFLFKFAKLIHNPKNHNSLRATLLAASGFGVFTLSFSTRLIYRIVAFVGLSVSHPNFALWIINVLSVISIVFLIASAISFFAGRKQNMPGLIAPAKSDGKVWPPPPVNPE